MIRTTSAPTPSTESRRVHAPGNLLTHLRLLANLTLVGAMAAAIWLGLPDLAPNGRIVLITFALAVFGWVATSINDTYIALAAALVYILAGSEASEEFFASLGDSTIWLLLASFIVAAAVSASGLSQRLALRLASQAPTVAGLCYRLTGVLTLTAFVIPATSGRAALMLPIFVTLSAAINQPRVTRVLALLFPTIILLSAAASLTGAGAHLATAEIVFRMTGERIGFARWLLLGMPFALISSFSTCWVILHLFLKRSERNLPLAQVTRQLMQANPAARGAFSPAERHIGRVVVLMIGLWLTEGLHGLNSTVVALLGAMAATMPHFGALSFKDALKHVEWNLLLFMAATTQLGVALTNSGAAPWLVERLFGAFGGQDGLSLPAVLLLVISISLLAHLLITSRTARSTVLVPLVILLGFSLGLNPTALAFISTIAAGYCLSLPVSAKPLALFSQREPAPFRQRDLSLLGAVLLPLHLGLLLVFTLYIWPLLGLTPIVANQPAHVVLPQWYAHSLDQIRLTGIDPLGWWAAFEAQLVPMRSAAAELLRNLATWLD